MNSNLNKHIWEGWTVQDFINELEPTLEMVQSGGSWKEPIKTKAELNAWCGDMQPYVKKPIKEVVEYFAKKYSIR